jgi:hypothetical protein
MNWALDTKKISPSLIGGEDNDAEFIDSSVLDTINMTGNSDIRKFYTDNFANFDEILEQSYGESLKDSIKYNQILLLEQQILEETSVYNYLLKNFNTRSRLMEYGTIYKKRRLICKS